VSENIRLSAVKFGADGLVPVVTQESRSGDVLMVAYANREALDRTLSTGLAHYFSRSRGRLWQKGETSQNVQRVIEVRLDCDGDAVLYRVEQTGPACHTGTRTCFSTVISGGAGKRGSVDTSEDPGGHLLTRLAHVIASRDAQRPEGANTTKLLAGGIGKISQKVGEEAVEVVVAANSEDDERLASEAADLLYHLLVLLQARGVPLDAVWRELESRAK
jgi:phosphoribosyl-AMP cyclohydrolase / phosphoribosyl-ATP pyrophosphohydrolase